MKSIGETKDGELRTLCQAFDALLKGKVDSAGDLLMHQRFKSQVMGLRDDSDKFPRFLELIPEEMAGVTPEETFFTRELAHKSAKADRLPCSGLKPSGYPQRAPPHYRHLKNREKIEDVTEKNRSPSRCDKKKVRPRKVRSAM